MSAGPVVIAGLGNPGAAYAGTRHNAGAMVIDALAAAMGVTLKRIRGQVRVAEGSLEGRTVLLGRPTTYMNESGRPVAVMMRRAGARPPNLLVCHDEIDIPLGRIRLKVGGGIAGHRGLESICTVLRSKEFMRLRMGVGRPPDGSEAKSHVLSRFVPQEREELQRSVERAVDGIRVLLAEGVDAAQRILHAPEPG